MKRGYCLLRHYIRESIEAIDMGDTQFSPDRIDDVNKTEENTPEEQELYDILDQRLRGEELVLDKKTADKLAALIKSEKYGVKGSGFFSGPSSRNKVLYRGHAFSKEWFEEYVDGDYNKALASDFNINYKFKKPYYFGEVDDGTGRFRGWTTDRLVAWSFALGYIHDDVPVAAVLCMYPEDNPEDALLDYSASMYKTRAGTPYEDEQEVINIKPVLCRSTFISGGR